MIPTVEEFLKPYQNDLVLGRIVLHKAMIEFAKLHVQKALKEAKVSVKTNVLCQHGYGIVDEETITIDYDLNNIK